MNCRRWPSYAAALLAALLETRGASAFCRATTCDPSQADAGCVVDAQGCLTVGAPLFWPSSCLEISVQADAAASQHIDYAQAEASASRAFAAWTSASCGSGPPSIVVNGAGPITCRTAEYNPDRGNANIVLFREGEWPYVGGKDALAMTFINFDPETGEIWDADIEVNAVTEPLSVGEPTATEVDLDSLLTHEAGHVLGLDHSREPSATMFAGYVAGSIGLRTLAPDDVAGVCSAYPPTRNAISSSCEPRHGYADLCAAEQLLPAPEAMDAQTSSGCTLGHGSGARGSAWTLLIALLALRKRRLRR